MNIGCNIGVYNEQTTKRHLIIVSIFWMCCEIALFFLSVFGLAGIAWASSCSVAGLAPSPDGAAAAGPAGVTPAGVASPLPLRDPNKDRSIAGAVCSSYTVDTPPNDSEVALDSEYNTNYSNALPGLHGMGAEHTLAHNKLSAAAVWIMMNYD